jgi:hypothetical protein
MSTTSVRSPACSAARFQIQGAVAGDGDRAQDRQRAVPQAALPGHDVERAAAGGQGEQAGAEGGRVGAGGGVGGRDRPRAAAASGQADLDLVPAVQVAHLHAVGLDHEHPRRRVDRPHGRPCPFDRGGVGGLRRGQHGAGSLRAPTDGLGCDREPGQLRQLCSRLAKVGRLPQTDGPRVNPRAQPRPRRHPQHHVRWRPSPLAPAAHVPRPLEPERPADRQDRPRPPAARPPPHPATRARLPQRCVPPVQPRCRQPHHLRQQARQRPPHRPKDTLLVRGQVVRAVLPPPRRQLRAQLAQPRYDPIG